MIHPGSRPASSASALNENAAVIGLDPEDHPAAIPPRHLAVEGAEQNPLRGVLETYHPRYIIPRIADNTAKTSVPFHPHRAHRRDRPLS